MTYVSRPLHLPDLAGVRLQRVDVQVHGVGHSNASYEVRIFVNNPDADTSTPAEAAAGYAGSYWVFGHGGCVGDAMHCHVPPGSSSQYDIRPPHQLTPQVRVVPIWQREAESPRLLDEPPLSEESITITLVPTNGIDADGTRREDPSELLVFERVSLIAYA